MLKLTRTLVALSLALISVTTIATGVVTAAPKQGDMIPGQYIVVFKDTVADAEGKAQALSAQHGFTVQRAYRHAVKGFAARIPAARLAQVQADPEVAFVDQDQVFSIAAPQSLPTGIDRIDGERSSTLAGDGTGTVDVDVAIIDTGIAQHEDLNVYRSVNCSGGSPMRGSCKASDPADGNGHGTHVAGTVAALDNGLGVVGVAPGARLWGVKVLSDQGSGYKSWIIAGIDYVTAHASEIEVANMSLGGSGSDDGKSCSATTDSYKKAICNSVAAGVTYAVAAGNSSADAATAVPAAYDMVITVSALADFDGVGGGLGAATCRADEDDTFANFSNYGADVDLIAPGVCITSTWPTALIASGYHTISGTSMASPHVAGAAALYLSRYPSATPAEVQAALQAAGTNDWNNRDDRDSTKEPLLNVATF